MTHPMQRVTDQSKLAKVNAKVSEYRLFFWIVGAVLLMFGFKYTTPSARLDKLEARQVDFQRQQDSLIKVSTIQANDIRAISLLQCFNKIYTNGQLRLVGIDCTGIR